MYSCTHWLKPRNPPPPPSLGSYTRALLVNQERRHLFVTPWVEPIEMKDIRELFYMLNFRVNPTRHHGAYNPHHSYLISPFLNTSSVPCSSKRHRFLPNLSFYNMQPHCLFLFEPQLNFPTSPKHAAAFLIPPKASASFPNIY